MIEAAPGPTEEGVVFPCHDAWLVGVLHRPASPAARGVLLVVGGPQTRVGSHRQFTLLARALAAAGVPVMRFDYRGMGDSGGTLVGFEGIAPDLDAALACFVERVPELREVVLWGLCDAASAALLHAAAHPAVAGMVLLNPWVTEGQAGAAVVLRHYYLRRALSGDFWRRLACGQVPVLPAARSLARTVLGRRPAAVPESAPAPADAAREEAAGSAAVSATLAMAPATARSRRPLHERMARGLERFRGPVLLVTSGRDLTAAEFLDRARGSRRWRRLLAAPRVRHVHFGEADHTFSSAAWRARVESLTVEWLASW